MGSFTALVVLLLTGCAFAGRTLPDDGKGAIKNSDMSGEENIDIVKQKDLDSGFYPKKENTLEQKPAEMPSVHSTQDQKQTTVSRPNPTTKHFGSGESFEQMHDQKKDYSKKKVAGWSNSGSYEKSSSHRPSRPRTSFSHTSPYTREPSSTPRSMDQQASSPLVTLSSPLTPVSLPVSSPEPQPNPSTHSEMRGETASGITRHPHSTSAHSEHHSSMQPKSENATVEGEVENQKEEVEIQKEEVAAVKEEVTEAGGSESVTGPAQAAPLTCSSGSQCFGDHECPNGRCFGLAVGKCNCGACVTFKPCSKDADCGGLVGACDHAVKYCNCEKGFTFNGYNLLDTWMKLCNIKDCTPSSRSCFGLPCNEGVCVC